ncbi:serine/threonine protein kinase [Sorangium sp. So ce1024]|uniref:serine/threonine protein kinase n=1 Tax=Sorangium sp. So ce1024 TaxID=3133327 RepID=UPI003F002A3E
MRGKIPEMDDVELQRRVGTVLCGKWTIERLLGAGGMAAVYVGVHKIGRRDAIKILHPEIARLPELRARFDQEARAVNRFVHPGAVEIHDIDTTADGCPFLVMELLDGESIAARARRLGGIDMAELLGMVDGLLDVLAAAHAHGIVHRDIKPDNLFRTRDGRLKVLDFGVARVRQAATDCVRTRTGTTLGTVAYMPPEQVRGDEVDARADVFAVGATMFRLITRRRIHEASSDTDLVVKMATLPAPPLASVAPETPPWVCAIVDRALAFDRDERYPSATVMQQDIRAVLAGHPPAFALRSGAAAAPAAVTPAADSLSTATTVWAPQGLVPPSAASVRVSGAAEPRPAPPPAGGMGGASRDALTAHGRGAAPAQGALGGGSAVAPAGAPSSAVPAFTQATQWTATTVGGRRLRWAALAFPLLAAGVLAAVYFSAVHVDADASSPAATGAQRPAAPAPSRGPAVPAERLLAKAPDLSPAKSGDTGPLRPGPPSRGPEGGPGAPQQTSCLQAGDCHHVCDDACQLECKGGTLCRIGARQDALVNCTGSGVYKVWCEGDCSINCITGAPCTVYCAPGSDCVIGTCLGQLETCPGNVTVCGAPCPG